MKTKIDPYFLLLNTHILSPHACGVWVVLFCKLTESEQHTISGTAEQIAKTLCQFSAEDVEKALFEISEKFSLRSDVKKQDDLFTVTIKESREEKSLRENRECVSRSRAKKKTQTHKKENLTERENAPEEYPAAVTIADTPEEHPAPIDTNADDFEEYPETVLEFRELCVNSKYNVRFDYYEDYYVIESYLDCQKEKNWMIGENRPLPKKITCLLGDFGGFLVAKRSCSHFWIESIQCKQKRFFRKYDHVGYPTNILDLKKILECAGDDRRQNDPERYQTAIRTAAPNQNTGTPSDVPPFEILEIYLYNRMALDWEMGENHTKIPSTPAGFSKDLSIFLNGKSGKKHLQEHEKRKKYFDPNRECIIDFAKKELKSLEKNAEHLTHVKDAVVTRKYFCKRITLFAEIAQTDDFYTRQISAFSTIAAEACETIRNVLIEKNIHDEFYNRDYEEEKRQEEERQRKQEEEKIRQREEEARQRRLEFEELRQREEEKKRQREEEEWQRKKEEEKKEKFDYYLRKVEMCIKGFKVLKEKGVDVSEMERIYEPRLKLLQSCTDWDDFVKKVVIENPEWARELRKIWMIPPDDPERNQDGTPTEPRQVVRIDDAAGSVDTVRIIPAGSRPRSGQRHRIRNTGTLPDLQERRQNDPESNQDGGTRSGTPERRQIFRNLTCNLTCKHVLEKRKEPKEKRIIK